MCGIHGLNEDAAQYLTQIHETAYWSESDRLTLFAITSKDVEKVKKVKSVLKDLLDYAQIADLSRAIINYNLARIALTAGDLEEMRNLLNLAIGVAPKLINKRLKLDPLFKTVQIEPQKISTT